MNLQLYYTASDKSDMNKRISAITTLENVNPVDALNIIRPAFEIGSLDFETYVKNANYCYIPELSRYYFINEPMLINHGSIIIPMVVDVLMSFKESILTLPCIVDKIANVDVANLDYDDGSFINQEGRFTEIKVYPQGFPNTPSNILIVAGK